VIWDLVSLIPSKNEAGIALPNFKGDLGGFTNSYKKLNP
jgi:hypothetical protein